MRKRAERFGITSLADALPAVPASASSKTTPAQVNPTPTTTQQNRNPRQTQKKTQPSKAQPAVAPAAPVDPLEEERKRKRLERFGPVAAPVSPF